MTTAFEDGVREWLSVAAAAVAFGLPERTIRRHCATGELVAKKLGSTWLIARDQTDPSNEAKHLASVKSEDLPETGHTDEVTTAELERFATAAELERLRLVVANGESENSFLRAELARTQRELAARTRECASLARSISEFAAERIGLLQDVVSEPQ
jgi:hypothetical protein